MEELIEKLRKNGLVDADGNIILEKYDNGSVQSVDQGTFIIFFGDKPFDYDNLIGEHKFLWYENNYIMTGEQLGYKVYFDRWKELGIIS